MKKQTMGKIIAQKRKEADMTQSELAEKMGVTDKAVSKWERDLSFPDVNSLPKLAEILGMSVDELMQVKQTSGATRENPVPLIFKAVSIAMGVCVSVLSILNKIDTQSAFLMLGIGVTCIGLLALSDNKE